MALCLVFLTGCETTDTENSKRVNQDSEFLALSSQFKGKIMPFPIIGILPASFFDEEARKLNSRAVFESLSPFEYNLKDVIGASFKKHVKTGGTPTVQPPIFYSVMYTDLESSEKLLPPEGRPTPGSTKLYQTGHSIYVFLHKESGAVENVGRMSITLSSFDPAIKTNLTKLAKAYDHLFPLFGETLNADEVIDFPDGILAKGNK